MTSKLKNVFAIREEIYGYSVSVFSYSVQLIALYYFF